MTINDTYTSTGHKFFAHQEAMKNLKNKKGQPIVTHVMLTDICQHTCAFCSVQARAGDSLAFDDVMEYLHILISYGLEAVILSGGGNPILYKCKKTGKTFNDVVNAIYNCGLEIGLITNGMPLKAYNKDYNGVWKELDDQYLQPNTWKEIEDGFNSRRSWRTVAPDTLNRLTWVRISMAGLDHDEREAYVPDINPSKTTLGFSYVAHDLYKEPADPHHGKVSTKLDLLSGDKKRKPDWSFESRINKLTEQIRDYVVKYKPKYVRLLPNCLEPKLIPRRCEQLNEIARCINLEVDEEVVFVQQKPPKAPHACYLGYIHPVLNSDGFIYPCDSCVLNEAAKHQFANPWRVCHWSEIAKIYDAPVRSLIADPGKTCPGCVFTKSNEILRSVVNGTADLTPPEEIPEHVNFV